MHRDNQQLSVKFKNNTRVDLPVCMYIYIYECIQIITYTYKQWDLKKHKKR